MAFNPRVSVFLDEPLVSPLLCPLVAMEKYSRLSPSSMSGKLQRAVNWRSRMVS